MVAIVAGAVVLAGGDASGFSGIGPAALVLGACACWAVDNNLTRQVSLTDASFIAMAKGLAAGSVNLLLGGALMALGVWLHVTEQHGHVHTHTPLEHRHARVHDAHHQHPHDADTPPAERHTHWHRHAPLTHAHAHFPDAHHRHPH
jgi:hypothetical protein